MNGDAQHRRYVVMLVMFLFSVSTIVSLLLFKWGAVGAVILLAIGAILFYITWTD